MGYFDRILTCLTDSIVFLVTLLTILAIVGISNNVQGMEEFEKFYLEKQRPFDDSYQKDHDRYLSDIRYVLERLAIRADHSTKKIIESIKVHINNRGRAEVIIVAGKIYIDIAILDLLEHAALEFAIGDVNEDDFHILEFNVAYTVALSTNKILHGIDPYNHASLKQEQWKTIWNDVLHFQRIFYRNCLAFILAHEIGHKLLQHEEKIKKEFPTDQQKNKNINEWNHLRRQMELEADDFAAELSLRAYYQPANIMPWFTLIASRRAFYGESSEYPSPTQREAKIRNVYQRWIDKGLFSESEYAWPAPLRPDRDMTKVDKIIGLERIKEVRTFMRNFLATLDRELIMLIKAGTPFNDAVNAMVEVVEKNRTILETSCESPQKIDDIITEIDRIKGAKDIDKTRIYSLIETACQNKERREYLLEILKEDPIDWEKVKNTAGLLKNSRPEFALAIRWRLILAKTVVRWDPEIYQAYLDAVIQKTGKKFSLKPYITGKPHHKIPPSDQEMLEFLRKHWNGSYITNNNAKNN